MILDILKRNDIQKKILDMVRINQLLEHGVSEDNVRIGSYSPYTIQLKKEKGQRTDHITLLDTGVFYDSFFISVLADTFVINANDEKVNEKGETILLTEKYNYAGNIMGLTEENMDKLIILLKNEVNKKLWQTINQ